MARAKELPLNLPSLDDFEDLFTTQAERDERSKEKVEEIPISLIDDFPDHPYHVRDDSEMQEMIAGIRSFGVHTPAILRRTENGRYQLISGHRRKFASLKAGLDTLPSIVRDMTLDEATIVMVQTNSQRENVLPSEKAFAYKMELEAMKRQGMRTDLTCAPVGHKSVSMKSRDLLASETGESKSQIQRYIRLTELIPRILELVDEGKIGMRPAVELSYLTKDEQLALFDAMEQQSCTPSHAQAIKLRRFSKDGRLSPDVCLSIMCEEKPNQVEQFRIPNEQISRFFKPSMSREEKTARIVKALELLEKQEKKRRLER